MQLEVILLLSMALTVRPEYMGNCNHQSQNAREILTRQKPTEYKIKKEPINAMT